MGRHGLEIFEFKPYPADRHHYVPRYAVLIEEKANGIVSPARGDPAPATRKAPGPRISLHAKLAVVDDEISVVTSHNLDPRSERYNTENGIVVRDREFARFLKAMIERDMAPRNAWYVGLRHNGNPVSAASRAIVFEPGVGLPGRVWASAAPSWIPDVTLDPNFPRAPVATREGLHAAFGFPILLRGEVQGVLEFFSREIRKPDDDLPL